VRLPLVAGARDCNDPGPTRSPSRDKTVSQRILVVDDNKDGADILAMLLQLMGHQTRVAYTGTEALEAANAYQPHVVLLDIGLPVMDGYEVARRLRQEPTTASTLLVAMTGYGQQEDKHRSELAGFDHHLVKPVAPDVLKTLLDGSAAPESTPSRL
jgi:CheY-like chemotaxis protein